MAVKGTPAGKTGGFPRAAIAVVGAGAALVGAYFLLKKGGQLQGTLSFSHKGYGVPVWAGIGLAHSGGDTLVWETHQAITPAHSLVVLPYAAKFNVKIPATVEKGTYDLWAFLHTATAINMEIRTSVGELSGNVWWMSSVASWWLWNEHVLTPHYIAACRFDDAVKVEGSLV
jgi:hypothetical protein